MLGEKNGADERTRKAVAGGCIVTTMPPMSQGFKPPIVARCRMDDRCSAAIAGGLAGGLKMADRNKLNPVTIKNAAPGRLQDGGGLVLDRSATGGKWIYRYSFAGKRREMGLGSLENVTLAEARRARDKWAAALLTGKDPISERERIKADEAAAMDKADPTLAELVALTFDAKKSSLKGEGVNGRWMSPLTLYVLPKLGKRRISTIHQSDIKAAMQPIWGKMPATAQKAITRTRAAFKAGKLMGYPCDPFTVDAAIHMLGELDKSVTPMPATAWGDIPALWQALQGNAASSLALRFAMLTLVRTDGIIGARFDEIEGDVWTVPAARMKGAKGKTQAFRVPLSAAALAVVETCRETGGEYLFPSMRAKGHITSAAYSKAMRATGFQGTPHGFRTSFRTWVQDQQATTYDIAETCLAHQIGGKVERAYARSDMLDQRRVVMDKWAAMVTGEAAQVVRLRG